MVLAAKLHTRVIYVFLYYFVNFRAQKNRKQGLGLNFSEMSL